MEKHETYHKPVLLEEVIESLDLEYGDVVVDATFGFGGHSQEILPRIGDGKLIGVDQDDEILAISKKKFAKENNIEFVNDNFRNLTKIVESKGYKKVDAILADLGISSYHFDEANRGFSFKDEKLDMRLSKELEISAYEIINSYPEAQLADILYKYADEFKSRRIAKSIVEARRKSKIESAQELTAIIAKCISPGSRINPATKTFQALRIAVNDEYGALEDFIHQAIHCLAPNGRLVIISFHSGEDRIVKNIFREYAKENIIKLFNKKPIVASAEEKAVNPRSRSAKMRVCIREGK